MSTETQLLQQPLIVFSDFDGTITRKDSNDYLTDNVGYGPTRRKSLNQQVLENNMTFRDAFKDMLDSITLPFDQCIELLLANITLDPGFASFYTWCLEREIPVIVLSSGMKPIIRALLTKLIGATADQIEIISNDVAVHEDGSWDIIFHDESHFGHDKALAIRPYSALPEGKRPTMVYCGDGVSDLSAAKETDLLFAKAGRDLVTYCVREKVPFTIFGDFSEIHDVLSDIVDGKITIEQVAARQAASIVPP